MLAGGEPLSPRLRPGDAAADVACGTGKLTAALAERVGPIGRVVGMDLSSAMIDHARSLHGDPVQVAFHRAHALDLPLPDDAVDAATIEFGVRDLADFEAGFRELRRIVRPGGRVVCLELAMPRPRWWGAIFHAMFRGDAPILGSLVGRETACRICPRRWPGSRTRTGSPMRCARPG